MTPKGDATRTTVSATVTPERKEAITARAEAEDRDTSRVLARALDVYLALPLDEAERMVADARGTNGSTPVGDSV